MPKNSPVLIGAILLAVIVALGLAAVLRPGLFGIQPETPASVALSPAQLQNIKLDASIKEGQLTGTYLNQNTDVAVTQVTIEAAVAADGAGNRVDSRAFTLAAGAAPGGRSPEFSLSTGALTPGARTLRVAEGRGSPAR